MTSCDVVSKVCQALGLDQQRLKLIEV